MKTTLLIIAIAGMSFACGCGSRTINNDEIISSKSYNECDFKIEPPIFLIQYRDGTYGFIREDGRDILYFKDNKGFGLYLMYLSKYIDSCEAKKDLKEWAKYTGNLEYKKVNP